MPPGEHAAFAAMGPPSIPERSVRSGSDTASMTEPLVIGRELGDRFFWSRNVMGFLTWAKHTLPPFGALAVPSLVRREPAHRAARERLICLGQVRGGFALCAIGPSTFMRSRRTRSDGSSARAVIAANVGKGATPGVCMPVA